MARGENTANHPNRQVHRNRWGDEIDPNAPKKAPVQKRDPGEYPTQEELEAEEPTFLEGPLGYLNWTDARVNRYR